MSARLGCRHRLTAKFLHDAPRFLDHRCIGLGELPAFEIDRIFKSYPNVAARKVALCDEGEGIFSGGESGKVSVRGQLLSVAREGSICCQRISH